jgi:hypothetical protein
LNGHPGSFTSTSISWKELVEASSFYRGAQYLAGGWPRILPATTPNLLSSGCYLALFPTNKTNYGYLLPTKWRQTISTRLQLSFLGLSSQVDLSLLYHAQRMQSISSTAAAYRPRRPKLNFRAFYITILFISVFAVISLLADQSARYKHGPHYGLAQRRALEELDSSRLVKRDEEVLFCRL